MNSLIILILPCLKLIFKYFRFEENQISDFEVKESII